MVREKNMRYFLVFCTFLAFLARSILAQTAVHISVEHQSNTSDLYIYSRIHPANTIVELFNKKNGIRRKVPVRAGIPTDNTVIEVSAQLAKELQVNDSDIVYYEVQNIAIDPLFHPDEDINPGAKFSSLHKQSPLTENVLVVPLLSNSNKIPKKSTPYESPSSLLPLEKKDQIFTQERNRVPLFNQPETIQSTEPSFLPEISQEAISDFPTTNNQGVKENIKLKGLLQDLYADKEGNIPLETKAREKKELLADTELPGSSTNNMPQIELYDFSFAQDDGSEHSILLPSPKKNETAYNKRAIPFKSKKEEVLPAPEYSKLSPRTAAAHTTDTRPQLDVLSPLAQQEKIPKTELEEKQIEESEEVLPAPEYSKLSPRTAAARATDTKPQLDVLSPLAQQEKIPKTELEEKQIEESEKILPLPLAQVSTPVDNVVASPKKKGWELRNLEVPMKDQRKATLKELPKEIEKDNTKIISPARIQEKKKFSLLEIEPLSSKKSHLLQSDKELLIPSTELARDIQQSPSLSEAKTNNDDEAIALLHVPDSRQQKKLLKRSSYYVQVGAYKDKSNAQQTITNLKKEHIPLVIFQEKSGNALLYKVLVGPVQKDEQGLILYLLQSKGYEGFLRKGESFL